MSETAIYRHKKRGTLYALLGIGKMQAEEWHEWTANYSPKDDVSKVLGVSVDMREVAVYRSLDDGQIWVRPREEFEDGRFELATNLRHSPTPPTAA